eukprot:TRINITY_DN42499_c0_g1_i1.p1 TRINITY_DN42499_c0_g1~~TRINITY_DN42499_c0_g1_i1.p1  ORF type:complete len:722 (+),score=197.60 TRINITY_DN42499_c0_g1_i1:73-2166(+)
MAPASDAKDCAWPELDKAEAKTTTFRVVLQKDENPRVKVDPRLWSLSSLASLDLSALGLARLDHLDAKDVQGDADDVPEVSGQADAVRSAGLRLLSQLKDLRLSDNKLGPALQPDGCLHGLKALRSLDLQGNALAELPAAVVSLTGLNSLNVGRNSLRELPWQFLSLLPELRTVAAAQNQLTSLCGADGDDDEQAGGSSSSSMPPRLTELTLYGNQLIGDGGLAILGQTASLAALDVAENRLTSLPQELATGNAKLSRLAIAGNPFEDKKLAKLGESQAESAPAKAVLELLRKGQSRRQMKAEKANRQGDEEDLLPAPRLWRDEDPEAEDAPAPQAAPEAAGSKKSGKKTKGKSGGYAAAPEVPAAKKRVLKRVSITRDALGVRPHFLAAVLHVVVDGDKDLKPFVFQARSGSDKKFERDFDTNLGLLEQGLDLPPAEAGSAAADASEAAKAAVETLRAFVTAQTQIHASPELGDKRRAGAMGTHNAAAVQWPLKFAAVPHGDVRFAPLSIGWMESKGVLSAEEFAKDAAAGKTPGVAKDVAQALQKPARALLDMPLCPHLMDAKGTVMSVHPLSNGWETRTTADARGALVLECSSAKSEIVCRKMLLQLIRDSIELLEAQAVKGGFDVRLLVEPVEVVLENGARRAVFPSREELLGLPALPDAPSASAKKDKPPAAKTSDDEWGSGGSDSDSSSSE